MVLAVVIERDPVALVDDEQRKRPVEGSQIARHRLHRAKHHLGARLLASEPCGEDVGLEPQASYLAWFCSTSSLTWASTSTRPRALRASSAITRLLPAPVGSTTTADPGAGESG